MVRGGELDEPQLCAQCGKRVVLGIMFALIVDKVKYRACSFECWKALKAAKGKDSIGGKTGPG